MLKISLPFKGGNPKMLICSRTRIFLLTTFLMTMILRLDTSADMNQFLFGIDALKDPGSLAVKLQDTRAAISISIAAQLSVETQQLLNEYDGASSPSLDLQKALLADLNQLIQTKLLYNDQLFSNIELSEQTETLISENPKSGEALVRLNRCLLADAYPDELASLSVPQNSEDPKGIETCRENLRQIKRALEDYRASNAGMDPQWLSELSPQYLEKKVLICPADPTIGTPGVLTKNASDPTLPCSYLYEIRHSEKDMQKILSTHDGDMVPIVRCEHHRLNLSLSGKLYRNGPQRDIYNSNKIGFSALADVVQDLQEQHGNAFLKTQEGREKLKQVIEELILEKLAPKLLSALEKKMISQLEAQFGKGIFTTPMGIGILKQAIPQIKDQVKAQLQSELETQLGEEFLKTEEGQDILQQLSVLMSTD